MTAQALQVEEKKRGRSEGTVFRFSGRAAAFEAYAQDVSAYVAECTANGRPIEPAKLTALQWHLGFRMGTDHRSL